MRVGMVCPYSLSIPGGVQGQVLGIAGALRSMGVEARVLAPCDGPPPETWVSPLGGSVAAAGNGSIAPIAPGPAASLRTIRALRDERFDIVHLHEPFVPGPTLTALLFNDGPLIGTFHRAGEISWYRAMRGAGRKVAKRLSVRCAVSALALDTASQSFGGTYELVWNGIDVDLVSSAPPWPTTGPTVLFLGRHEPRKGLAVLIEAVVRYGVEARIWVAGEAPRPRASRSRPSGTPVSNGSGRWGRTRNCAASAVPTSSLRRRCTEKASAWCSSRVWRPVRPLSRARSRVMPMWPVHSVTLCWCRRGTPPPWPRPSSRR